MSLFVGCLNYDHFARKSMTKIFFVMLFLVAPIVDSFTGFLLSRGTIGISAAGSPSQLFRFFLLFFSLYLLRTNIANVIIISLLASYLISLELLYAYAHTNFSFLASGIVYSMKIVFIVTVILLFKNLHDNKIINGSFVGNLFYYSVLIHLLLIIVPKIFGVGLSTYGDETFGSKGFFPSNNGLGYFCGLGSIFVTYWNNKNNKNYKILYFLITLGTILIGSKTALLLTAINLLYFFFTIRSNLFKLVVLVVLIAAVILFFDLLSSVFFTLFDVVVFRFKSNPDFFAFIFSSRDDYASMAHNHCSYDGILSLRSIFGTGTFMLYRNPGDYLVTFVTLESDFLDLYYSYGILGLIGYLSFFLGVLILGLKRKVHKLLLFLWMILFLHSVLAGHIIFDGMASLSIFALWFLIKDDKKGQAIPSH